MMTLVTIISPPFPFNPNPSLLRSSSFSIKEVLPLKLIVMESVLTHYNDSQWSSHGLGIFQSPYFLDVSSYVNKNYRHGREQ